MYRYVLLFAIAFNGHFSKAQTALDTLRYVDLHIQPSFKNYYRKVSHPSLMSDPKWKDTNKISQANWDGYSHQKKFKNTVGFSGFTGKKSYPQASHDILQNSKASILLAAFSPFERKLVSEKDEDKVRLFGFKTSLRSLTWQSTRLPKERQKVIFEGNPFAEYNAELKFLIEQERKPSGALRGVIVIRNREELDQTLKNGDIALIPSIEGLSSLFGYFNYKWYNHWECLLRDSSDNVIEDQNSECYKELVENIRIVKNAEYKPFLIAPSHLAWNRVVAQAKAFDTKSIKRRLLAFNARSTKFREKVFNKHTSGIVDSIYDYTSKKVPRTKSICTCDSLYNNKAVTIGTKILNELISDKNGRPILIDMRHMDIQARLDYINLVKEKRKEGRNIPIVISHTAVSGKDFSQARFFGDCPVADRYMEIIHPKRFYKRYDSCLKDKVTPIDLDTVGWFHPWSINMCNEEILAVYQSRGILGISMEQRVLGTDRLNYRGDYKRKIKNYLRENGFSDKMIDTFRIAEPLMRNILYIAEHSGYAGNIKSWEHMAIGSDFDGAIDPIDICPTAAHIPQLYQALTKCLPVLAAFTGKTNLLCGKEKEVEVLLNKLFYQNGERFILENYK